jgi:CubicO group peptidase (beta-lactamase class C family)
MSSRRPFAIVATLVALGASSLIAQSPPPAAAVASTVDSLARAWLADHGSPAVSIAVIRGRDTLAFGGWGQADLENEVAATPRTVYEIGSVTKQFTSVAVMQEIEKGRIRLDDSIGTYLPSLPAAWRGVTVTQLLNHTSGIPSYTSLGPAWVRRWGEEMPPDTLVALTADKPMDFPPGTQWRYNNSGYVILGMLIEKVTGRSWADDVQARFAAPLGLPDTRWCDVRPVIPRRAHGYESTGDGFRNAAFLAMSQPFSAGALCSTVGDLAKWNALLHGGKLLSAASYTALTTPQGAAIRGRGGYGFGISQDTLAGRTMIQHGGGINGFLSENAWFPETGISVTVLTNATGGNPGKLMRQVARVALGVPLLQPPKRIAMSADAMAKYVGEYDLALPGGARLFSVTLKDGMLSGKLDAPGQGPMEMVAFAEHSFFASSNDDVRVVFTASNGRVTGFTLRQGGGAFTAKRRP